GRELLDYDAPCVTREAVARTPEKPKTGKRCPEKIVGEGQGSMQDVNTQAAGPVVNTQSAGAVAGPGVVDDLPVGPPPANHGRTGAGWALFVGGAVGALIAGVGFILLVLPVILAGAA